VRPPVVYVNFRGKDRLMNFTTYRTFAKTIRLHIETIRVTLYILD